MYLGLFCKRKSHFNAKLQKTDLYIYGTIGSFLMLQLLFSLVIPIFEQVHLTIQKYAD